MRKTTPGSPWPRDMTHPSEQGVPGTTREPSARSPESKQHRWSDGHSCPT